jgi:hypothetical protein
MVGSFLANHAANALPFNDGKFTAPEQIYTGSLIACSSCGAAALMDH